MYEPTKTRYGVAIVPRLDRADAPAVWSWGVYCWALRDTLSGKGLNMLYWRTTRTQKSHDPVSQYGGIFLLGNTRYLGAHFDFESVGQCISVLSCWPRDVGHPNPSWSMPYLCCNVVAHICCWLQGDIAVVRKYLLPNIWLLNTNWYCYILLVPSVSTSSSPFSSRL